MSKQKDTLIFADKDTIINRYNKNKLYDGVKS